PFANGGHRPPVHMVRRVRTVAGELLYEHSADAVPRVIRSEHVAMMNSMMNGTIDYGTARNAAFGWPAAGKTGTSQNARDAWFVGYTANLTTGVWFGNDDGKPMRDVTGGSLPAIAWKNFMAAAHEGIAPRALHGGLWTPPPPEPTPEEIIANDRHLAPRQTEQARRSGPVPPADIGEPRRTGASFLERLFRRQ